MMKCQYLITMKITNGDMPIFNEPNGGGNLFNDINTEAELQQQQQVEESMPVFNQSQSSGVTSPLFKQMSSDI